MCRGSALRRGRVHLRREFVPRRLLRRQRVSGALNGRVWIVRRRLREVRPSIEPVRAERVVPVWNRVAVCGRRALRGRSVCLRRDVLSERMLLGGVVFARHGRHRLRQRRRCLSKLRRWALWGRCLQQLQSSQLPQRMLLGLDVHDGIAGNVWNGRGRLCDVRYVSLRQLFSDGRVPLRSGSVLRGWHKLRRRGLRVQRERVPQRLLRQQRLHRPGLCNVWHRGRGVRDVYGSCRQQLRCRHRHLSLR